MCWKLATRSGCRRFERDARAGIQRDQVHFAVQMCEQPHDAPRIGIGIVYAFQQHILEGQLFPRPQRVRLARVHQIAPDDTCA